MYTAGHRFLHHHPLLFLSSHRIVCFAEHNIFEYCAVLCCACILFMHSTHCAPRIYTNFLRLILVSVPPALLVRSSISLLGRPFVRSVGRSVYLVGRSVGRSYLRLLASELCDRISRCSISLFVHSWIILTAKHPLCLYVSLYRLYVLSNLYESAVETVACVALVALCVHRTVHTCVSFC